MNVSFGHFLSVDSGASKKYNGNYKESIVSGKNFKPVYTVEAEVCPEGFRSSDDYVNGITQRIYESYDAAKGEIKNLPRSDRKLSGIVIYAPGPTINNYTSGFENLKIAGTEESLKDINYDEIPAKARAVLASKGIKLSRDFKIMATNDMLGTGAAIAKQLYGKPYFKEGYSATFLMAGGGLGVGQIEHYGKNVIVKTTESGHINAYGTGQTLEKYGASAGTLIREFCEAMHLSEKQTEKFLEIGNAKIATIQTFMEKDPKVIDKLKSTGLFNVETSASNKAIFTWKNYYLGRMHDVSSRHAIDKFLDAIAHLGAIKVTEGVNNLILTGPLAKGIKNKVDISPELFEGKSFNEILKQKILKQLDNTGRNMAKLYNFDLITDIDVINNNEGTALLLKGKFVGEKIRGSWVSIPEKAIKTVARMVA